VAHMHTADASIRTAKPLLALNKPAAPTPDRSETVRRIAAMTGASPTSVLLDLVALARGPGRIQLSDYVRLRLFDQSLWEGRDRNRIVGEKQNRLIADLINDDREWVAVLQDKVAAAAYLGAYGFPVVPTIALWQRGARYRRSQSILTDEAALVAFLKDPNHYPLFGKPINGLQSLGTIALERYVTDTGHAISADGQIVPIEQLAAEIASGLSRFLFQRQLKPHPSIAEISAGYLGTVRLLTLNVNGEAQVLRACAKLNGAGNAADNYWRTGNLLATIDRASGVITAVKTGLGFEIDYPEEHPATGARIVGTRIPFWEDLLALGVAAAETMRRVPLIGWDIGVTADGAVIIEMNETPDFLLPQFADQAGLLEPALVDALEQHDNLGTIISRRRLSRLTTRAARAA